jgi:exodeoxyribonuclease VII small subunit
MAARSKKLSFEDNMSRLNEIVELLENPETGLEDALINYKNGVEIAVLLNQQLTEAEKEVMVLSQRLNGSFELSGFDEEDE